MDRIIAGVVLPLMFWLIGGLFARMGYRFFRDRREQKRRCLSRTRGTIVDMQHMGIRTGHRYRVCYYPVYEYTVGSQVLRVELQYGTTSCPYRIGDGVTVCYDSKQPDCSYLEGYKEDLTSAAGSLVAGIVGILCGVFVFVMVFLV